MLRWISTWALITGLAAMGLAQQNNYKWNLGLYGGLMNYQGDLSYKWLDPHEKLNNLFDHADFVSYGASLELSLSQAWAVRLLLSNGEFIANDRTVNFDGSLRTENPNFRRSLNARTEIMDASILFTYYFDNNTFFGKKAFVVPFITGGIGWTDFNVYGDLFSATGQRYYYWSDNSIRTEAENTGKTGTIIEQDGDFETDLTALQTEGEDYATEVLHYSGGLGLKFRLSNRLSLNLETIFRFTNTDFLDDVSGRLPTEFETDLQAYASDPAEINDEFRGHPNGNNDFYSFSTVSLHYYFARKKQAFKAPVINTNPFAFYEIEASIDSAFQSIEESELDSVSNEIVFEDSLKVNMQEPEPEEKTDGLANENVEETEQEIPTDEKDEVAEETESKDDDSEEIPTATEGEVVVEEAEPSKSTELSTDSSAQVVANENIFTSPNLNKKDTIVKIIERQPIVQIQKDTTIIQIISQESSVSAPESTIDKDELARLKKRIDQLEAAKDNSQQRNEPLPRLEEEKAQLSNIEEQLNALQRQFQQNGQVDQGSLDGLQAAITALQLSTIAAQSKNKKEDTHRVDTLYIVQKDSLQKSVDTLYQKIQRLNDLILQAVQISPTDTQNVSPRLSQETPMDLKLAEMNEEIRTLKEQLSVSQDQKDIQLKKLETEIDVLSKKLADTQEQFKALQQEASAQPLPSEPMPSDPKTLLKQRLSEHGPYQVFFGTNSATINIAARQTLNEVMRLMDVNDFLQIRIIGYTDTSGNPVYNKKLAEKRARAVADFLNSKGIEQSRIFLAEGGEDSTAEAAYGRRVDLELIIK